MIWQDAVIAGAQATFALALIPTILASSKPPLATSVPMAAGVLAITVAVATLELWWSAATGAVTTALWAILVIQKWGRGRRGSTAD
jgi:hypothetical protein